VSDQWSRAIDHDFWMHNLLSRRSFSVISTSVILSFYFSDEWFLLTSYCAVAKARIQDYRCDPESTAVAKGSSVLRIYLDGLSCR